MSDSNPHDYSHPPPPRNSNILPTEEERQAEESRKRKAADKEAKKSYKERQSKAAEAANDLARSTRNLTVMVIVLTAVTAVATWFQGCMNHKSWKAAQDTLDQMKLDSETSGKEFQTQLTHYDDGLGRTGLLATHAGEQAVAGRDAALASKQSADTLSAQFETNFRAWIAVEGVKADSDLTQDAAGLHFSYRISYKVVGNLPATNIETVSNLTLVPFAKEHVNDPIKREQVACKAAGVGDIIKLGNRTKYPPDTGEIITDVIIPIKETDIMRFDKNPVAFISPVIVGCIDYQYLSSKRHHQTPFAIEVRVNNGSPMSPSPRLNVTVQAKDVVFRNYLIDGIKPN